MEQTILKLVKEGWNVANGTKTPMAWKEAHATSESDLSTASIIMDKQEAIMDSFTGSVAYALDFPKDQLKALLSKNKCLPANYNELEMTAKFIKA